VSIIDDCVQFLEDLILGDFNEDQMVSAQVIGGLISLIPIIDQVMDVRDVSGSLYRINKHGGMAKATLDEKIGLGFAAFGVIPEVGSAFKTVFKPLYKERKALKGTFNGGVAMVERMLGVKKGGAVKWVRALDWAGNTQAAIAQANLALESSIAMLGFIAAGHWWCPSHLEQLARDVMPTMESLRGKLAGPIREASAEIRGFLEEMLGEHAAAVAMAVAQNAAATPRASRSSHAHNSGHSTRGSHANQGGHTSSKTETPSHSRGQQHEVVGDKPRTQAKTTASKTATSMQRIAYETYNALNFAVRGLMGEHIVDHHVIEQKKWGLDWNGHDWVGRGEVKRKPGWQSQFKKINDDETPIFLCTPSTHVLANGIDSVWLTNRSKPQQFAIVEAKANMNQKASLLSLLGEAKDHESQATRQGGRKRKGASISPSTARSGKVLQMSKKWVNRRINRDFPLWEPRIKDNYSRHVFLVTPIQAAEHTKAMEKILEHGLVDKPDDAQRFAKDHAEHNVEREFTGADIDTAEATYNQGGKPKKRRKTKK